MNQATLAPKQKSFDVFASHVHKPITSPVMVGRAPELDRLSEALLRAEQGQGRCILISAEAGIGKSRLLGELCQRALLRQHRVVRGHCFEQDGSFPYAPWIDRSEERRVGKECRSGWSPYQVKK